MEEVLTWLELSRASAWIRESDWPYPILLDMHLIGLATAVGFSWVIDLRLLGFGRHAAIAPFRRMIPVIWCGFALNAVSGLALFAADASRFYASTNFRIKLVLIATAMTALAIQARQFRRFDSGHPETGAEVSPLEFVTAASSLAAWLGAIIAGRLLAYTS